LSADEAFQWLGTGGFTADAVGLPGLATFGMGGIKGMIEKIGGERTGWRIKEFNFYERRLEGAQADVTPLYDAGSVKQIPCLRRGEKVLPLRLVYRYVWEALEREGEVVCLIERAIHQGRLDNCTMPTPLLARYCIETLEALLIEGWVYGSTRPGVTHLNDAFVDAIGRA
jgi:hypothetical protein